MQSRPQIAETENGFQCPTCEDDGFDAKTNVKIHHKVVHNESIAEVTCECDYCGETFQVLENELPATYCTQECRIESGRVEKECPGCEETFKAQASQSERRVYCSRDCRAQSARTTGECEQCGEEFTFYKFEEGRRKYCSRECKDESQKGSEFARRKCPGCGVSFQPINHRVRYCSLACVHESLRDPETRPNTFDDLLIELYVEKDLNLWKTWKRAKTALDEKVTKSGVRDRLKEMGVFAPEEQTFRTALEMDPDEFKPDDGGDSSWKNYYGTEAGNA